MLLPREALTCQNRADLETAFESCFTHQMAEVILDMNEVEMINSAGAGILAAMLTSIRSRDGALALVGLSERNRTVLEFLHLHQFARLCDSIDEARKEEC